MAWEGAKLRSIANTKAMLTDPFSHNIIRKDVVEEELMIVDSVEEYRIESLYCNIALVLFGSSASQRTFAFNSYTERRKTRRV